MVELTPGVAFVPALFEVVSSVSVLAVATGSGASTACPGLGFFEPGPYSFALLRLVTKAAASS